MIKSMLFLSAILLLPACSTRAKPENYAALECDSLRTLVTSQDFAASTRGIELHNDRGMEEIRTASGSPWAGQSRTRDEEKLVNERGAIREAYRRKGCKA